MSITSITLEDAINDVYAMREDYPESADVVINRILSSLKLEKSHRKLLSKHNTTSRELQEAKRTISRLQETIDIQHECHTTSFLDLNAQMDCYRERLGEDLSYPS